MRLDIDKLQQRSTAVAVAALAGVAGWVSYIHVYDVVRIYGHQSGALAYAYPVTTDGLIYAASMVLLGAARKKAKAPALAWLTLVLGILITTAANVWDGLVHGAVAAFIAGWPALALVLGYELCMMLIRSAGKVEAQPAYGLRAFDLEKPPESPYPYSPMPVTVPRTAQAADTMPTSAAPETESVPQPEPMSDEESQPVQPLLEWDRNGPRPVYPLTADQRWPGLARDTQEPEPVQPIPLDAQRIPVRFGGLGDQVGGAANGARKS